MKLWQVGLSVMCCGSLLLSGCYNQDNISALEGAQKDLRNEIKAIRKQIKGLEEVILTLNRQIQEIRSGLGERQDALPEAKPAAGPELTTVEKRAANIFTRAEFAARVGGMTPEHLIQLIGKPDKQAVKEGSEYWTYNTVSFKISETDRESVDVQIIFENKRVDRTVFMDDVKYGQ